jgi:hypothetical protein
MKITFADKSIAWLALLSGLSISAVAVYYSVAGLISIFAAAAIPIAIMGIVLELSKLVATVWLKQNWFIAPRLIKAYLLIAVAILMIITSMGIFGYLSKAHLDQAVPTGEVAAKVALIDEKIKTERDNIDAARRALTQMDAQVDQMLGRSDTERGAERAVQIRRNQAKERAALQADISKAQKTISALNQERAPIASELRKVEAEVGPIKYIAALLYGDNPDQNVLERAVRWVIILIVIIFDPLAVVLLLASQYSFQYFRKLKEEQNVSDSTPSNDVHLDRPMVTDEPVVEQQSLPTEDEKLDPCPHCGKQLLHAKGIDIFCPNAECEYNKSDDPEVNAFFTRLREAARKLDEEERAEAANAQLAQYEQDDGPLTDEQIEQLKNSAENDLPKGDVVKTDNLFEDNEPYPFPMQRPLEGDAKIESESKKEDEKFVEIVEEETITDDSDPRRIWKMKNPNDTIKRQRWLYERGLISQLPWEVVEKLDEEKNEITKVEYVQNSEQNSESIWQKIKNKDDN